MVLSNELRCEAEMEKERERQSERGRRSAFKRNYNGSHE
jgi:hypothetical protein